MDNGQPALSGAWLRSASGLLLSRQDLARLDPSTGQHLDLIGSRRRDLPPLINSGAGDTERLCHGRSATEMLDKSVHEFHELKVSELTERVSTKGKCMTSERKDTADTLSDMRETLAERIRRLRRTKGMTQADLGKSVGVSRTAVTLWERGDTQALKGPNLLAAAKALEVSAGYLETGREETHLEAGPSVGEFRVAPVVGTAQLGAEGYWHDVDFPVGHGDGYVDVPTRDPNAYALRVKGDSMAPAIRSGWVVVVEPNRALVPGEYVLVKTRDGRSMVKELLFQRGDEVSLMSVNDDHGRLTLSLRDIEKIHYVGFIVPPSKIRM